MQNPFAVLGIDATASLEEVRDAWRRAAKRCHPDAGGSAEKMVTLNLALAQIVAIRKKEQLNLDVALSSGSDRDTQRVMRSHRQHHDISSFTIDVLPVDSFEYMLLAAEILGTIIDQECPYLVEFTLHNSGLPNSQHAWCRCELMPEAGGTTVHLTIGGVDAQKSLTIEAVRDELIYCVNGLH